MRPDGARSLIALVVWAIWLHYKWVSSYNWEPQCHVLLQHERFITCMTRASNYGAAWWTSRLGERAGLNHWRPRTRPLEFTKRDPPKKDFCTEWQYFALHGFFISSSNGKVLLFFLRILIQSSDVDIWHIRLGPKNKVISNFDISLAYQELVVLINFQTSAKRSLSVTSRHCISTFTSPLTFLYRIKMLNICRIDAKSKKGSIQMKVTVAKRQVVT